MHRAGGLHLVAAHGERAGGDITHIELFSAAAFHTGQPEVLALLMPFPGSGIHVRMIHIAALAGLEDAGRKMPIVVAAVYEKEIGILRVRKEAVEVFFRITVEAVTVFILEHILRAERKVRQAERVIVRNAAHLGEPPSVAGLAVMDERDPARLGGQRGVQGDPGSIYGERGIRILINGIPEVQIHLEGRRPVSAFKEHGMGGALRRTVQGAIVSESPGGRLVTVACRPENDLVSGLHPDVEVVLGTEHEIAVRLGGPGVESDHAAHQVQRTGVLAGLLGHGQFHPAAGCQQHHRQQQGRYVFHRCVHTFQVYWILGASIARRKPVSDRSLSRSRYVTVR